MERHFLLFKDQSAEQVRSISLDEVENDFDFSIIHNFA